MFFGVFCGLIGTLILKSKFLPWSRRADGACGNGLLDRQPQAFPPTAGDPYILLVSLIAENLLALWLLVFGVNEAKWRMQAGQGDTKWHLTN